MLSGKTAIEYCKLTPLMVDSIFTGMQNVRVAGLWMYLPTFQKTWKPMQCIHETAEHEAVREKPKHNDNLRELEV